MIKSFRCKDTEKLYNRVFVKKFSGLERSALKRLRILDSADTLGVRPLVDKRWYNQVSTGNPY
jgi:plasmid maintenance system killer protein